jgi:3-oxoacyl-[acyl-carrier protein] reductase
MDLGIEGRRALVCAASRGLGKGCAMALAGEGAHVTITGRDRDSLEATAEEIRAACGVEVTTAPGDIASEEGRAAALAACPEPDILINNAGGPPPGDFREWDIEAWQKALLANMITPIMLIRATVDGMIARRFGRIVNITSSAVKTPNDKLGLSNGARTGLTGFVAGIARQTVRHNVTINGLLPGSFDTHRIRGNMEETARRTGRDIEELIAERAQRNPAGRLGNIQEFGAMCAFLCSVHAGYVTGQNVLMDGGAFRSSI